MGGAAGGASTVGGVAAAVGGAAAAEPSVEGREERPTRGRKALPPRVFTILKLKKGKKGEGVAETGNGMGNENERKEKGFI